MGFGRFEKKRTDMTRFPEEWRWYKSPAMGSSPRVCLEFVVWILKEDHPAWWCFYLMTFSCTGMAEEWVGRERLEKDLGEAGVLLGDYDWLWLKKRWHWHWAYLQRHVCNVDHGIWADPEDSEVAGRGDPVVREGSWTGEFECDLFVGNDGARSDHGGA